MNLTLDARTQRFLADLDRINARQSTVEKQLSSGYAIDRPSDGADKVVDIVQLRSDIERGTAVGTNLDRVQAEVDTSEAAMRVAVNLLERARTLAAQTATSTAQDRPSVAQEVKDIHQQLVDLTKTMSEGRFVFSGDKDQTALYSVDWTQPAGIVRNTQTANTRQIEDAYGGRFTPGHSASQIFDTRNADDSFASDNVFNAVYQLGKALENDDQTAVQNASQLITTSLDHLGRELTFYGNVQNRVANAKTLNEGAINARKTELSLARDTDLPSAVLELSTLKVHQEAALGAEAQSMRKSLFDYMG